MGNERKMRPGTSGHGKRMSEEERQALRERRRAYYESLSPEEKRAFQERRKHRRRVQKLRKMALSGGIMLALVIISVVGTLIQHCGKKRSDGTPAMGTQAAGETQDFSGTAAPTPPDWVTQDLIRISEYSRPGTKLEQVNGIVVHYVANEGTTAKNNRDYFDNLADTKTTSASSHFVIGLEGEILQCVPLDEIAYASNERNEDTISIECCHPEADGKFTEATYNSLVKLVKWLEEAYHLQPESVIRHYDVTGKLCPKYFVENEEAWTQFLRDIVPE